MSSNTANYSRVVHFSDEDLEDIETSLDDIDEQTLDELKKAFALFDKDGNGAISAKELGTVMRSLGQNPSETELQILINQADVDCNGVIDFPEFAAVMCKRSAREDASETIREAFRVFDISGSGVISMSELRNVMQHVGEGMTKKELDEIMADADKDGDGYIEYEEFVQLITYNPPPSDADSTSTPSCQSTASSDENRTPRRK